METITNVENNVPEIEMAPEVSGGHSGLFTTIVTIGVTFVMGVAAGIGGSALFRHFKKNKEENYQKVEEETEEE